MSIPRVKSRRHKLQPKSPHKKAGPVRVVKPAHAHTPMSAMSEALTAALFSREWEKENK